MSLSTFLGFGQDYVEGYFRKTGNAVFLHILREKIEKLGGNEPQTDGPEKKITRLAIGVEGGFDPSENKRKYEYKDHLNVVVFPDAVKVPYPNIDLPLLVRNSFHYFIPLYRRRHFQTTFPISSSFSILVCFILLLL